MKRDCSAVILVFCVIFLLTTFHNANTRYLREQDVTARFPLQERLQRNIHLQSSDATPRTPPASGGTDFTDVMKLLLIGYDKRVRPNFEGGPVTVNVSMYISSINSFEELSMDFMMTFYFRQWWHDPRLAYGGLYHKDHVTLGGNVIKQIWLPDTHFEFEKKAKPKIQQTNYLLRIYRTGLVMWARSNSVINSCIMDLRAFPMDTQFCNFSIESYGYDVSDVIYRWKTTDTEKVVQVNKNAVSSQFRLGVLKKWTRVTHYDTGSYSGLVVQFEFSRRMTYYMIQIFVPCAMIVMISWVSFWIDSESTPARISLGITTVLAMTTLMFGVQSSLPKVPYVKSVDVYMIMSFTLVFASLAEYAAVNFQKMKKRENQHNKIQAELVDHHRVNFGNVFSVKKSRRKSKEKSNQFGVAAALRSMMALGEKDYSRVSEEDVFTDDYYNFASIFKREFDRAHAQSGHNGGWSPAESLHTIANKIHHLNVNVNSIDKYSRVVFPLTFLIFNIVYWATYLLA